MQLKCKRNEEYLIPENQTLQIPIKQKVHKNECLVLSATYLHQNKKKPIYFQGFFFNST